MKHVTNINENRIKLDIKWNKTLLKLCKLFKKHLKLEFWKKFEF